MGPRSDRRNERRPAQFDDCGAVHIVALGRDNEGVVLTRHEALGGPTQFAVVDRHAVRVVRVGDGEEGGRDGNRE